MFLIAPVLDAAMGNPAVAAIEPSDPWLSEAGIGVYAQYWRGRLGLDDPLVDVDYVQAEGMVHVYPLLPIREGRAARRHIVATINGTPPRQA